MKNTVKVLLFQLPPGLVSALLQHRPPGWDFTPLESDGPFDAVITSGKTPSAEITRGLPLLSLPGSKKESLSVQLRRLRQMMAQPALYAASFQIGTCRFSPQEKMLETDKGASLSLTERETEILLYLAKEKEEAASREDLLRDIWRYQEGIDTHTLETHIYRLRQKLAEGTGLSIIEEKGYRLIQA